MELPGNFNQDSLPPGQGLQLGAPTLYIEVLTIIMQYTLQLCILCIYVTVKARRLVNPRFYW
jgi:hypothetical protein